MGAWIEIFGWNQSVAIIFCRTPRWVRGLKYDIAVSIYNEIDVAPHDGCVDWNPSFESVTRTRRSRTPRWVRGLKSDHGIRGTKKMYGRTPRWVRGLKYCCNRITVWTHYVAPHDGCVDWNYYSWRNTAVCSWVAPHDGCVDWNYIWQRTATTINKSHPTMGAWIEI